MGFRDFYLGQDQFIVDPGGRIRTSQLTTLGEYKGTHDHSYLFTTEVDFWIQAVPEHDIYIGSCSVVISDAGAVLSEFGNLSALTNGIKLEWRTQEKGVIQIHEGLKTNFEFCRLSGGFPAIGGGTTAFQASNVFGTSEAYLPFIDFQEIFGLTWGLRLRKGTKDKLVWTVRDNITTIDQMDIIAYGITF